MGYVPQLLVDTLLLGGIYMLMSIGLTLSFGVTRVINFAHGEAVMLGAYGAFWLFHLFGIDPLISTLLLIIIGCVAGMALFGVSIKPVLKESYVNQILLTFGIALILQNLALVFWTADERSLVTGYAYASWTIGGVFIPVGRLIGFLVAAVIVVSLFSWLRYSEQGRATRALAQNSTAAVLMGINVPRLYAFSFGLSVGLGAAAGAVLSFLGAMTPFMGMDILVKGFAIIVLGGLGSVAGTALGALLLAFAESAVSYYVPDGGGWAEAVAFTLLFLILILRPQGLVGKVARG